MAFLWAIGASILVSVVSLIGIFSLLLNEKLLNRILILLVGFGAGGLIGSSFLHLIPETLENSKDFALSFLYVILGFILFFVLERYFFWRHCHKEGCEIHPFTYLNLVGDFIHNFGDGLIIGVSFFADIRIGIVSTLAIIMHEVPQELGDFGILIYGGLSKFKALVFNYISATAAILGTVIGYFFASHINNFSSILLPFAAGGFIYIASCDLIPELHRQPDIKKSSISMLFFILGILLMWWLKALHH